VGETLTAEIGTVEDADGLPGTFPDDYRFQWYRVDADGTSIRTPIAGATSATCTLAAGRRRRSRHEICHTAGDFSRLPAISYATLKRPRPAVP